LVETFSVFLSVKYEQKYIHTVTNGTERCTLRLTTVGVLVIQLQNIWVKSESILRLVSRLVRQKNQFSV